jgi:hypothetical protein
MTHCRRGCRAWEASSRMTTWHPLRTCWRSHSQPRIGLRHCHRRISLVCASRCASGTRRSDAWVGGRRWVAPVGGKLNHPPKGTQCDLNMSKQSSMDKLASKAMQLCRHHAALTQLASRRVNSIVAKAPLHASTWLRRHHILQKPSGKKVGEKSTLHAQIALHLLPC